MRKDSSSSTAKYMRFVIRPVKYYTAIRSANIRVNQLWKIHEVFNIYIYTMKYTWPSDEKYILANQSTYIKSASKTCGAVNNADLRQKHFWDGCDIVVSYRLAVHCSVPGWICVLYIAVILYLLYEFYTLGEICVLFITKNGISVFDFKEAVCSILVWSFIG
jgi:hypothetical protein